jgi:hypothetical protein
MYMEVFDMSIIKKTVLFLLLGICFMSGSTLAVLIEQDWKVPGDKLLTVDTATGLKWLDITQTLNQSYDAVSAKLVAGQPLAGFKYATLDEIVKFWSDAGIPDINMGFTAANYEPVLALEKLVGFSPVPNQVPSRSIAISGSAAGQGSHFLAALAITQIGPLGPKLGGLEQKIWKRGITRWQTTRPTQQLDLGLSFLNPVHQV